MSKFCLILALCVNYICAQLAFPEDSPGNTNESQNGRVPVYVPGRCPANEWFWPGNQETDWVCDCATGFVYMPSTEKCHELYRQGPCKKNEYVVLKKGEIIPQCVTNPCRNDTLVPFKNKCYRLYKGDACPKIPIQKMLGVNHTSLELECLPSSTAELNIIQVRNSPCPAGSKRSASGQCRTTVG